MSNTEKALGVVALAMFGATGFAWSAPILTPVTIVTGWVTLVAGIASVLAITSGRCAE